MAGCSSAGVGCVTCGAFSSAPDAIASLSRSCLLNFSLLPWKSKSVVGTSTLCVCWLKPPRKLPQPRPATKLPVPGCWRVRACWGVTWTPGAGMVGTGLSAAWGVVTLALVLALAVVAGFATAVVVLLAVTAKRLTFSARSLTAALAALALAATSGFGGSCAEDAMPLFTPTALAAGDVRGRAGTIPPRALGTAGAVAGL